MDLGSNYLTQTLGRLRRILTGERSDTCWRCVKARRESRTEIVRRHSDMGLLRSKPDRYSHHHFNISPNDIARLIWLRKMRVSR